MNKPEFCLALSVTLTLAQANLLKVQAEPNADAIWQKMTATGTVKNATNATKAKKAVVTGKTVKPLAKVPVNAAGGGHAMLFLGGNSKQNGADAAVPAAALTIHPSISEAAIAPAAVATTEVGEATTVKPGLLAMNEGSGIKEAAPADSNKQLLAQLAPDQVVAQGAEQSNVSATPIPPVVTGTVDLEEFKTTNVIDLKVAQSRTFKLKNKIVRTSISDPSIAEPVVVSENQLVLLGKTPGTATLVLWDDAGNSVAIDLRVTRDYAQLQSTLREIDPRIIVKAFSVGGTDRVLLLGDVDHAESVVKAFAASNVFMDDRGMNVQVANNRLVNAKIGEQGGTGGGGGGGAAGQLAQLSSVDRYTFFPNTNNNISKAQLLTSDGGRVTSLVKVRKVPLIVLHVTFMEMNTTAARALGVQLGFGMIGRAWQFGIGGNNGFGNTLSLPQVLQGFPGVKMPGSSIEPAFFGASSVVITPTETLPITGIRQGVLTQPSPLLQQAVLFGSPGGATFNPAGLANLFTGNTNGRGKLSRRR